MLVVGVGNPDRGDDGVGPLVATKLAEVLPADVTITCPGGNVLSLIPEWPGFEAMICIDAAAPLTTPGRIHRFDLAGTSAAARVKSRIEPCLEASSRRSSSPACCNKCHKTSSSMR